MKQCRITYIKEKSKKYPLKNVNVHYTRIYLHAVARNLQMCSFETSNNRYLSNNRGASKSRDASTAGV
jgi:hypothetical protein